MSQTTLVHRKNIQRVFWEPYIITGYRKTDTSFWECIKYAFTLHNDVGNFWTHFLPAVSWAIWLYYLSFEYDFTDPFWLPLLAIWAGACSYAFCSSIAHFLACKSLKTRQIAFMIDYLGIAIYSTGGFVAYYFYEQPLGVALLNYKWALITLCVAVNTIAILTCSLSRFFCEKYRYFVRSGSFFPPYMMGLFPFVARILNCVITGEQCIPKTLHIHFIAYVSSVVMVFFFVSKFPERYCPGSFDYFFHSHQLFHVSSVVMTTLQLYVLQIDAIIRRDLLQSDPHYSMPDIFSTIYPVFAILLFGSIIIGILSCLVFNGVFVVSNKLNQVKKGN